MTEQTKPLAKVFKSFMPYVRIPFRDGTEAVFRNGRLVTTDKKLAAKLEDLVENDKALGIYIDPEEKETDKLPPGSDHELKQEQLRAFMAQQTTQLDAGTTENSSNFKVATTQDSPTTGGKSVPAPHFTRADTAALLASRTATTPKPTT